MEGLWKVSFSTSPAPDASTNPSLTSGNISSNDPDVVPSPRKSSDETNRPTAITTNPFSPFSFSNLLSYCDSAIAEYFPCYKLYLPSALMGLLAMYRYALPSRMRSMLYYI